jgi:aminoglycoside phosphotransferase (APT) family kinase protein
VTEAADNPTIEVRAGEELDAAAVDACIKRHVGGLSGTPSIRQFAGGHSNLTYAVGYPERELVLRRPPHGTRPKSGHDMQREYRIMNALRPVFPAVPRTCFHCGDEALIGAPFYVMERVPGRILRRTLPADWGLDERATRALCIEFWDTLIDLHLIDYHAVGLADFGQPDGYVERQVRGWSERYLRALTPDAEEFGELRGWLASHMPPASGAAILHGDYRLDNAIWDAQMPPHLRAVLDWEICAIGDPLMDLGNALAYWIEAGDPAELQALALQPSAAPGMLTRAEVLAHYAARTGRDLASFDFYLICGYFRLAVILQQIYYRYYHGQTANRAFAGFGASAQALGRHCAALIARGNPT